jgi:hypothetical protein
MSLGTSHRRIAPNHAVGEDRYGLPLEGVAVRAGNVTALTDPQGRFILAGVRTGVQELTVDGSAVTSELRSEA